jgi:hypothetical protein
MKNLRYLLPFVLAFGLIGCGSDPKPTDDGEKQQNVTTGTTPAETLTVPDGLKNAAYEYKGLANDKLRTYTATLPAVSAEDGTEVLHLKSVADGKATFTIERTGSLVGLGTEEVVLDEKGVTTVGSSVGVISPTLELPADLEVGKEWTVANKLDTGQKLIEGTSKVKAIGMEKVTVPAGEFDCIVLESVMDATISGSQTASENGKTQTRMKAYYAKGVGIVKLNGTTKRPNGKTDTLTIVLKSIGA